MKAVTSAVMEVAKARAKNLKKTRIFWFRFEDGTIDYGFSLESFGAAEPFYISKVF